MSSHFRKDLLTAIAASDANEALATSTKSKYRSAIVSFLSFCKSEQYQPIPTVASLSAFISFSCRRISTRTGKRVSPRTVEAYLSGIASAFSPICANISGVTSHPEVRKVLKGCKKQFSIPINRKEPLLLRDLITVSMANGRDFDSLLFRAMLFLGFHALHRLGEITVPDNPRFRDNRKIISRLSLFISDCGSFVCYVLPYHKGDPFFLGSTVIVPK